jgi:ribonuclease E
MPQDWARLANELGVEVPPEAEPAPAQGESTETEPVEESESPFPTLETPAELMAEIEEERTGGFDATEPGPSRERHGRHRNRRRGGGRPDQSGLPETARRSRDDQSEARPPATRDDAAQRPQAAADRGEGEPSRRHSEESGPGRGKRRRRRRGSGRGKPDSEAPAAAIPAAETIAESVAEPLDAELPWGLPGPEEPAPVAETAEAAEAAEEQADDSAGAEKALHRGIPSWEEVVGVVISANMASRAKNPDRRSSGRTRSGPRRGPRDRPAQKTD